ISRVGGVEPLLDRCWTFSREAFKLPLPSTLAPGRHDISLADDVVAVAAGAGGGRPLCLAVVAAQEIHLALYRCRHFAAGGRQSPLAPSYSGGAAARIFCAVD